MKLFDITCDRGYQLDWLQTPHTSFGEILLTDSECYSVYGDHGNMVFQRVSRPNYDVWYSVYDIKKRVKTHSRADVSSIELSMLLEHAVRYNLKFMQGVINQMPWQYNLMHSTCMDSIVQFETGVYKTLDIHVKIVMVEEIFSTFEDLLTPFMEAISQNRDFVFSTIFLNASPPMVHMSETILYLIRQHEPMPILLDRAVTLLFSFAVLNFLHLKSVNTQKQRRAQMHDRLNEVLNSIHSDVNHFRGIKAYARMAHMSETTLKSQFVKMLGKSPKQLWLHHKVMGTLQDVLNSEKTFAEIALDGGFSDGGSFSKTFKNIIGVSPISYRLNGGNIDIR